MFLQQGITFWEGGNDELRSDSNTGLVYRSHVSRDWILGGSLFFDYNFQHGHSRLSVGVDAQSKNFYGGLNYYFAPLDKEWRRGRPGYEERVLEGLDLHWSFTWEELRLSGAFGTWSFDGEGPSRRQSASVSAGYMVYPGVFLEIGYEHHDNRSVDEDWNVGLAFQYSLPEMNGAGGSIGSGRVPDLWRIVDRERRILYEERLARPRVSATLAATPNRVEEGDSVTVQVVLGEALEEDVFFSVAAASSSTVGADDYDPLPSRMMIPAGAMSAEETFGTVDDGNSEPAENLDLELRVLQESFFSVSRGNPHHARVVIGASDNTIVGFATELTSVTEGVDVNIPLALGEPAPASGLVLTTSSDKAEDVTTDAEVRISPGVQNDQYIRVTANNDNIAEPAEMVRITLSEPEGGLPEGWRIGRSTHMLMIQPNGLNIAFASSASEVNEDVGTVNLVLVLNESAPAGLVLNVSSNLNEDAVPVSSTLAVAEGARRVELPVRVIDDALGEGDEVATIRISDAGAGSIPEGWSIGQQSTHALTIKDNDLFVGFERSSSQVRESDRTTDLRIVLSEVGAPTGGISLSVSATGNDDNDISFTSPVSISAGEKGKTLSVTIAQDNLPEDAERIVLTLSGQLPESWEYGQATHELTILPNGNEVAFESSSTSVNEGVGTVNLALELSRPAPEGLVLAFDSSSPDDAVPAGSTLRVSAGATSATLSVRIIDDDIGELGETVTISILGRSPTVLPEGWSIGSQDTHDLIVTDDDLAVGFESSSSQVRESELTTELPILLSAVGAPTGGLSLSVSATGNEGNDISFSSLLPVSGGDKMKKLMVALTQDGFTEDDERIVLTLSGSLPDPWKFSQRTHELTILSNEQTAMFAEAGQTVNENVGTASFKVVLSKGAPAGGVPLQVAITSGNDNNDVAFTTQNFTITEGNREHTISVGVNNDNLIELSETVTFTLTKGASAAFPDVWGGLGAQTTFALTITDDDSTTVGFATPASTLEEGDTTAILTVRLNGSVSQNVEVTLSESGDGNNDLTFSPASLTFAPGETEKQVTLTVNSANDDALPEGDVEITYVLAFASSPPSGVTLATDRHVVTFVDDDRTIRFKVSSSSASEGTNGHPVAVVLNFDPPAAGLNVTAVAATHQDDVSIPSPRLSFTGSTRELSVLVDVLTDIEQEGAEIVQLELETAGGSLPAGWTLVASGDDDHDLTILPSGQTAMFAEAGKTVNEGDGTVTFNVTLSEDAPSGGVPLQVAIASGNDDGDVTFTTQNFTITGGNREHPISVAVNDDSLIESSETVTFTLTKDASATFPDAWGGLGSQTTFALTITDNDSTTIGFTTTTSTLLEGDTMGATLTVRLNGSVSQSVVVALSESGDGNNDIDFSPVMLVFDPGETEEEVRLTVNSANDDALPEGDVEITYTLADAGTLPDGVRFDPRDHVVTFADDDRTISFKDSSSSAHEGTTGHPVAVVLNFDPPADGLVVAAAAADGDHKNDVSIPSPMLSFTGSARELFVSVDVLEDNHREGAEIVQLELAETATPLPAGWTLVASGDDDHDLTIHPNDHVAMFAEAGKTVNENVGTTSFKVALSDDAPAGGVPLQVAISSGNENNDVTFTTQNFTIDEGSREHTISVDVNDDSLVESSDTVTFTLTKDASATFPDAWGDLGSQTTFDLIITDDDSIVGPGNVGFMEDPITIAEGSTKDTFMISLAPLPTSMTLRFVVNEIQGTLDSYTLGKQTSEVTIAEQTFPAGTSRFQIPIEVPDDYIKEPEEKFLVQAVPVSIPAGYTLHPASTRIVVPANDQDLNTVTAGDIGFVEDPLTITEGTTRETFMISHEPIPSPMTLRFIVDEIQGTLDHFTVVKRTSEITIAEQTFPAGTSTFRIPIVVHDDYIREPEEKFLFQAVPISVPAGFRLRPSGGRIVVPANDQDLNTVTAGDIGFVEDPLTITEGTTRETFMISHEPIPSPMTLRFIVEEIQGTLDHFTVVKRTSEIIIPEQTFPAGTSTFRIPIEVPDDYIREPEEKFLFQAAPILVPAGFRLRPSGARIVVPANDQDLIAIGEGNIGFVQDPLTITEGSTGDAFMISHEPLPSPMTLRFVVNELQGTLDNFTLGEQTSKITIAEQTFPAGSSTFRIPIEVPDDYIKEPDEIFLVRAIPVSVPAGFNLRPAGTRIVIPANDQDLNTVAAGDIGFVEDPLTITEGSTRETFMISHEPIPSPMTLRFFVEEIQGTLDHFTVVKRTSEVIVAEQTFPAGTSTFRIPIVVPDDNETEPEEKFLFQAIPILVPAGFRLRPSGARIVVPANDPLTVSFSGGRGTQSTPGTVTDVIYEGIGGSATVTLNISPPSTKEINIPLTVTGNHAVYGDRIFISEKDTSRATVKGKPSTNDVMVSVPANTRMVTLKMTAAQDSGNANNDVTVSFGTLPPVLIAGTNDSWTVTARFPPIVNFAYEGEHSLRASTNPEIAEVADLSLKLNKTHNEDIIVHLNKGGTAGATNGDYRILNQDGSICGADNEACIVTFPAGQTEAVVKFLPRRHFSGSETAIINIQIPEGSKRSVQLGKQDEIQFSLIDGTASAVLPTATLSYTGDRILTASTDSEIAEIVDLKVQLNNASSVSITVHLNKGGTASAISGDYRILNQDDSICGADNEACIVTLPAGQTEAVVKFWPRRYFSGSETAIIELEVPAENRDKVVLGLNNRVDLTLDPGI